MINPYDNPKAFGRVQIGKAMLPGIVTKIDGADRKFTWDKKKGSGTSGASTDYKGDEISDSIKFECTLLTAADFLALDTLRAQVVPAKGAKATAQDVVNEILNSQGIKSIAIKSFGQVSWDAGSAVWTWSSEWIEYRPPAPTKTGKSDGSKPADPTPKFKDAPSRSDDAMGEIKTLLDKAAKA